MGPHEPGESSGSTSPPPSSLPERLVAVVRSPGLVSALVGAVTLACFARVLGADFVFWDDGVSIYENPHLGGLSLERLRWIFTDVDSTMRYIPLTLLGWSITYQFWGLDPFGYHLGNWLLHGCSAALAFLVLRQLILLRWATPGAACPSPGRITLAALLGALVWSLHPLRVEPVAWATDRSYCQAAFFAFLSVWYYLRAHDAERRRLLLVASVVSYVCSLLSHPIGMGLIGVLVVIDVYPLGRLGGRAGWWRTAANRRAVVEKVPYVAAALVVGVVTVAVRVASAGVWVKPVTLADFGVAARVMQGLYVWAYYAWRPWYPVDLAPVYTTLGSFDPFSLPFIGSALAVVGVTTALVLLRRRWPLGLAVGACHLVLLVPVLGLWEHPHYHSDRYSLIVSLAWSALLAGWIADPRTRRLSRTRVRGLSVVVIAALAVLSYRQSQVWNNSVALFEHMLRTLGDDPYRQDIHVRLGVVLAQQGEVAPAMEQFRLTLALIPYHPVAGRNLGRLLENEGRLDEARTHYENIGAAQARVGLLNDAITTYRSLLRVDPQSALAHNELGAAFGSLGQLDRAIAHWREAARLRPDDPMIRGNLEIALRRKAEGG